MGAPMQGFETLNGALVLGATVLPTIGSPRHEFVGCTENFDIVWKNLVVFSDVIAEFLLK